MSVTSGLSESSHVVGAVSAGLSVPPFQMLALDDAFAMSKAALIELWEDALRPLAAPLFSFLGQEGERVMLAGFTLCWLWSILAMVRTRSAEGKSLTFNHICILSYLGGIAYLAARLGDGWAEAPAFWLYLLNLTLTAIDLKLVNECRWRARLLPASRLRQRHHVGGVPGAADLAALGHRADQPGGGAMSRREQRAARREEELCERILSLERHVAQLRRERDVALRLRAEANVLGPDHQNDVALGQVREPQRGADIAMRRRPRRAVDRGA